MTGPRENESHSAEPEWWERALDGTVDPAEGLGETEPELAEEFTPPPAPPLPVPEPPTVLGFLGCVAGFLLMLRPQWIAGPLGMSRGLIIVAALGMIVAGALTLLYRLREGGEDEPPPPDDGAVV